MSDLGSELPPWYRAIVTLGVLIEGTEASRYLTGDLHFGDALARLAERLAEGGPEVSLPLSATLLRDALREHREGLRGEPRVTQTEEKDTQDRGARLSRGSGGLESW